MEPMASLYGDLDRPPLHAESLRRSLVTSGSLWSDVEVLDVVASTNAYLVERASDPQSTGRVVIAEQQTAGRGRLDRTWTAPARSGLTLSVLVRPPGVDLARWPWIPLLTSLAVAAAVRREAQVDARLKWPNDVMVEDRKLAGVLVELVEVAGRPPAAVIGIGLNVSLRRSELPVDHATSLALEHAATTDRALLARAVLRNLDGVLGDWVRHDGDARQGLLAAYVEACATIGHEVLATLPGGETVEGTASAVDASGRLVVDTAHGRRVLGAGDLLHLRPQA